MNLIERYVEAVKSYLPEKQHKDVGAELFDDLRSQVEERESEAGRELTEGEQAELLKTYGHPMLFASRFRQHQYLIGPALFPYYWSTMKAAVAGAFGIFILISCLGAIGSGSLAAAAIGSIIGSVVGTLAGFPWVALQVFLWVTVVFALMGYFQVKLNVHEKWDPKTLPKVSASHQVSRTDVWFEVVSTTVFLAWLIALATGVFQETLIFHLSDGWQLFLAPFIVLQAGHVACLSITLARPHWTRFRSIYRVIINSLGVILLGLVLTTGNPLVLAESANPGLERLVEPLNNLVRTVMVVAAGFSIWEIIKDLRRLIRKSDTHVFSVHA